MLCDFIHDSGALPPIIFFDLVEIYLITEGLQPEKLDLAHLQSRWFVYVSKQVRLHSTDSIP